MSALVFKVSYWIVERSARLLPKERERYAEQWLADLEDRRTPLRKFSFALGIWRASLQLRREWTKASRFRLGGSERELDRAFPLASWGAAHWYIKVMDSTRMGPASRARLLRWMQHNPEHICELVGIHIIYGALRSHKVHEFREEKESWLRRFLDRERGKGG